MQFEIGDKAVVPALGVGIVKDIKRIDMGGDTYEMYVIKILDNGLTYKVPVSNTGANGVRGVIPPEAVDKVYEVLRDRSQPLNTQTWNRRHREYMTKIKSGDPLEVSAVLRDLCRLRTTKTLSFGERRMYDQAHSLVVQELAVARDVAESVIIEEIDAMFVPEEPKGKKKRKKKKKKKQS